MGKDLDIRTTFDDVQMIDSHVNLHAEAFADDLDAVIERARDNRVAGMLTISDMISSTDAIRRISARTRLYMALSRRAPSLCG